jgi:predicted ester cyclase
VEALLDSLYDAYNRHRPAEAAALYRAEARHFEIAQGSERAGRQAIRESLERLFEAFPDARWEERERVVSGNRAAVTYLLTGSLQGRLGPFEPVGQRLELRGVHVFRAMDGLSEASEDYGDSGAFGRQMRIK